MVAQKEPYEFPAILAFAGELMVWRMKAGMSKIELAERLGYSPQLIGQVEGAKNLPSKQLAEDLDTFFETNGLFLRLWKLINETRHVASLPRGFSEFLAREAQAKRMYAFEPSVIKGLFQSRDYAYEMLKAGREPEEIEQLVAKRMERQEVLNRPKPPLVFVVLDEVAIKRRIGSREVMCGQIEHLIELAQRSNVTLQIVPDTAGSYAGLMGAFDILGFEDGHDIVYIEGHVGGQLIADPAIVQEYALRYDLIRGAAMSADESLKLLRRTLESL
ncbi:helix-turn-helix domain-containing protein [Actinoallomurus acaciae]